MNALNWIVARLHEGSTWAGLSVVTLGVGELAKVKEAPMIADVLGQAGAAVVGGASPWAALAAAAVSVVLRDKGAK